MKQSATLRAGSGLLAMNAAMMLAASGPFIRAEASITQRISDLQTKRDGLVAASEAIITGLADGVDLTDEQTQAIENNASEAEKIEKQISALKKFEPKGQGTVTRPAIPAGNAARVTPNARGGFSHFGEFAALVRQEANGNADARTRLVAAVSTFGSEGVGADGGFLVPPEFSREIWTKVQAEENLLNRCAQLQTSSNSMALPKDETTPWQTTGGIQVYWEGEGQAITASKPSFEWSMLRLVKLSALVPVADELLEDAVGLESWLRAKAPAKMAAKINTAIISGTGVGQPLGILKAASKVGVDGESANNTGTILYANINKMWARMYAPWRRNAVWLINQDAEPALEAMAFDPAATSKVPVYLGPTGAAGAPYASLKGRPVIPLEATSALATEGDIILCDLNQYWALTKAGGIQTATSMHLYFDQSVTAFRFVFRLNGQPAWSKAITPQNGSSNTRSWAVTLTAVNR